MAADRAGDADTALAWTRRQVAADPLDEEAHRRLMGRLAANGDGAGALTAYTRLRERLRRELGTAPSAPTRELAERIRSGPTADAADASPAAAGGSPPGAPAPAASSGPPGAAAPAAPRRPSTAGPPLIGRERELGELEGSWEAARAREGQVVVLAGEAGIGKTRLATELLAGVAEQGGLTASCAALDLNGGAPLGLWAELARDLADGLEPPPRDAAWPADLGVLVPEVARRFGHPLGGRPAVPPELERARLFEAAAELLSWAARERPVAILIEDLHLADAASLEMLAYVGRRVGRLPVLCVLTRRLLPQRPEADAVEHALRGRGVLTRELVLGSLPPGSMTRLVQEIASLPEAAVRRVVAAADGNPLLAVESARAAGRGEGGPPASLRAAVRATVARLSPGAARLTELCAVAGRQLERTEVLRLPVEHPADAAAEGVDSGLLVAARTRVGFRHALLREAVYADLPEPRRATLHEALADALAAGGDLGAPRRAAEAARHLRLAGQDDRAVAFLIRAADHARAVAAVDDAARFLSEALAIRPGEPDVLLDLAEALMWLGRPEEAETLFVEAIAALRGADTLVLARAWLRHASWNRGAQCVPHEVLGSTRRVLELLEGAGEQDGSERREALAAAAWAEGVAGDVERSHELLAELDELLARSPPGDVLTNYVEHARGQALTRAGRFTEVYEHATRAGEAAQRAGRPDLAYGPWVTGASAAICADDLELALELIARGLQAVEGSFIPQPEIHLRAARTTTLLLMDRVEDARREAVREREVAERSTDPGLRAIADHDRGMVALGAGELELAERMLAEALTAPAAISRPLTRIARAEALARLGRTEEAEVELRATALEPVSAGDMPDTLVPRLTRVQGLIAAQRGEPELAARRLEEAAAGWRRVAGVMRAGESTVAPLADLGRPGLGIVRPDRELERVERELGSLASERSTASA